MIEMLVPEGPVESSDVEGRGGEEKKKGMYTDRELEMRMTWE